MNRHDLARDLRRTPPLDDAKALCAALDLGTDPGDRQRQGRGLTVRCPRHGGVSCSVTFGPDGTVRVRCFGCDFRGDALDLVAEVRGLHRSRFSEVLREATALTGGSVSHFVNRPPNRKPPPENAPAVSDESYDAIARMLLEACSPVRSLAPDVAHYLDGRGVFADAEAVGVRGLPRDTRDAARMLLTNYERTDLERAGLLRPGYEPIDWSRYALLVPWFDRYGRITCLQRRRLDDLDDTSPRYRSPPCRAPHSPFGVELLGPALAFLGPNCEVVIVEGAIDCLARRRVARARQERSVVLGAYSASSPCEGLPLDLLAGRRVVLALDGDEAGERACAMLAAALDGVARELIRERPNGAKDWADTLRGTRQRSAVA